MMKRLNQLLLLIPAVTLATLLDCSLLDIEQTPTKTKMQGIWEVVEAYDEEGNQIIDKLNFPITLFDLQSDNSVMSTAGPMVMMLVYGNNKYTSIASKIDQTFNYANAQYFTNGEWFIGGGTVPRFTLMMKLKGLPGQGALTDLLDFLGISKDYLDITIYHKFKDVKVDFELFSDSTMTWEFDNTTTAVYNAVDDHGEPITLNGISVDKFSHCKFVFKKRVGTLQSLIQNAANKH